MGLLPWEITDGERGQSETVGFILVLGMVILGSVLVATLGAIALDGTESRLTEERAENALTQFDSKAALVALGQSDSHGASLGQGVTDTNYLTLNPEAGWINVTITDRTTGNTAEIMRIDELGAIIYEGEEVQLAYQGGGVWRRDPQGGQMISPPEFHYRGETLTLPAINVSGDPVLNEDVTITRDRTIKRFPDPLSGFDNPIRESVVNVTVGSEFYRAWGEYFEERTEGQVTLDEVNETASLTLASPIGNVTADSVVAGQAAGGTLRFQGNPGHPCHSGGGTKEPYTDSYNSTQGSYCAQYDESEINSAGDITFGGDIRTESASGGVQADLVTGKDARLHGNAPVHGNISYVDSCRVTRGGGPDCEDAQASGPYSVQQISEVQPTPQIDFTIENTADRVYNEGQGVTLGSPGQTTLEAGTYYTDEIDLDGQSVQFDTGDGDITLVVNQSISLDGSTLTVTGDNDANVYVNGGGSTAEDLEVVDSSVSAPNDDASKLTVLGRSNFTARVEGSYTGVIYAPVGTQGTGSVDVFGHLYGAVVTGDLTVGGTQGAGPGAGGTVHWDKVLDNQRVVPPDDTLILLTFLHITENRISVTG
jgi:hypothetical protein